MPESDIHADGDGVRPDPAASAALVGAFTLWFAQQRWEWSPPVYRLHGYTPGEVEPTTELVLAHKHPDDRDHVAELIARTLRDGEPFSSRHRIIDTAGAEHAVMVVADRLRDDAGALVGTSGYYIDLTDDLDAAEKHLMDERMPEIVEARAVIEQAKGVLMRMYGIGAEQAFRVLAWRSQETNIKLRDIAARVVADLALMPAPPANAVTAFDHLLLTNHTRIDPDAGEQASSR
ncbi:PAS and ANTAR domain-containing protein [Nocardia sp. NPDC057353]|uniref:PAS and ANTAR domain-containing protein n=1 Tax=Nocardia sp. NPDC057353 TaxID=3346104 RepID=UPI0036427314